MVKSDKAKRVSMNQPSYQSSSQHSLGFVDFSPNETVSRAAAEQALQQGNRYYNRYLSRSIKKELEKAVHAFRQAVQLDPTLPEAQVKLASALWDQGKITLGEAIRRCEEALALDANCAEAALFLGYFLRRDGQLERAQSSLRQVLSIRGGEGKARARMALGGLHMQQVKNASVPIRLAGTLHGLGWFFWGLATLPADQKAFRVTQDALLADAGVLAFTLAGRALRACRLKESAKRLYDFASRRLPEEPLFFHLLGDLQVEQGNYDAAIYYYSRCRELDPDDLMLHRKLGQLYNRCDDPAMAAKSLEKLVEAQAEDFDTLYTLAQIYTDAHDYMRALYYYKSLLTEQPDNPYLHSHIAFVLFKLEDYDGAIEHYETAVKLGRDPVWVSTVAQTLATIYHQIKQDTDATIQLLQTATQLDASNLDAWAMLGDILTEQGEFEEAVRIYRHLAEERPDNADCQNYLGYLLWQLDKNDEAIAAYRQAIRLDTENPIAFNNLGVIYLDEKCQLDKALEMFKRAVSLKPDYTLACFNIGRVHEALGQISEAAQYYSKALALNAQNPELPNAEIQERLEQLFQV
jgi:tetratricopeptide (TPR) repeat protein